MAIVALPALTLEAKLLCVIDYDILSLREDPPSKCTEKWLFALFFQNAFTRISPETKEKQPKIQPHQTQIVKNKERHTYKSQ